MTQFFLQAIGAYLFVWPEIRALRQQIRLLKLQNKALDVRLETSHFLFYPETEQE